MCRRGPRVDDRPQLLLQLGTQVLVVGWQRELLAQMFERLVDGKAGSKRCDLEQHPTWLSEVDRPEIEAVDDRRRRGTALDHAPAPRFVLLGDRSPGDVVDGSRALQPALARRRVEGVQAAAALAPCLPSVPGGIEAERPFEK